MVLSALVESAMECQMRVDGVFRASFDRHDAVSHI